MPADSPPIDTLLGTRIHTLRAAQGLTLDALARRAGVSRAMLSRIERGESSPTAQLLNRICGGLGVTLSVLFAGADTLATPLARHADQPLWRDPASGYLRRAVSPPGLGDSVDIVEIIFPPSGDVAFAPQRLPEADQQIWILDGSLEVTMGAAPIRLETGDCLRTGLDRPIRFRNLSADPTRYAVIVSHRARAP